MTATAASSSAIRLRLSACYIAVFMVPGVGLPFWPTWLESRHLSDLQIGLLLALGSWVKLVGNPLFSLAADRTGNARLALIAAIVASDAYTSTPTSAAVSTSEPVTAISVDPFPYSTSRPRLAVS